MVKSTLSESLSPLVRAAGLHSSELTDHYALHAPGMEGADVVYHIAAAVEGFGPWSTFKTSTVDGAGVPPVSPAFGVRHLRLGEHIGCAHALVQIAWVCGALVHCSGSCTPHCPSRHRCEPKAPRVGLFWTGKVRCHCGVDVQGHEMC